MNTLRSAIDLCLLARQLPSIYCIEIPKKCSWEDSLGLFINFLCFWDQAIAKDAILSRCKIISEPWDCGGLYLVGRFPNWDR